MTFEPKTPTVFAPDRDNAPANGDSANWDVWVNSKADAPNLAALRQRFHHVVAERGRAFDAAASTILAAAMWLPMAAEAAKQAAEATADVADSVCDSPIASATLSLETAMRLPDWIADLVKPDGGSIV